MTSKAAALAAGIIRLGMELPQPPFVATRFQHRMDDAPDFSANGGDTTILVDGSEIWALGKFEPQKLPNEYALAVHELVQAKIEQRAPEVEIETEKRDR